MVYEWDKIMLARYRLQSASSISVGAPLNSAFALCRRFRHFSPLSTEGLSVFLDGSYRLSRAASLGLRF